MSTKSARPMLAMLACLLAAGARAADEVAPAPDKTLSPYFQVKTDDPDVDGLPLLATRADVQVAGVIADVRVTQVYTNAGRQALEAIYVFPGSTRAAVYGMRMTIGARTLEADIQERTRARETYDRAKAEGRSTSLLEQQRPNVFQMNVANIMPGDAITVELRYTEMLVPTEGIYTFVYPTVVGPRYGNTPADAAPATDRWIASPYQHAGQPPAYTFGLAVDLRTGVPIRDVACESHQIAVRYPDPAAAVVTLDPSESAGGNRDFILHYRLAGEQVESGLLLYRGETESFFLLTVQPPRRVATADIPPREYVFIVDVSGSMHGFPLDISKTLLRDLIANLRPTDVFNVLLFAGGSTVLADRSLPATAENAAKAIALIDGENGGGGTELLPALRRALALPRTPGTSRSVVVVTDGYVGVEREAFAVVREHLGEANLFAFGIGSSVNRFIIEGLARAGQGEPFVVTQPGDAPAQAATFRRYIQTPVLAQVRCDFGAFEAYDVEPAAIPDVMAERPVVVCGKWRGEPRGTIAVTGTAGQQAYRAEVRAGDVAPADANRALRSLWARRRIAVLGDDNALQADDARVKTITQLGLTYSVLTAYTSFVAVDTVVRNEGGKMVQVKQPLPMPAGVSDLAVGEPMVAGYGIMPASAPMPQYSMGGGGGGRGHAMGAAQNQLRMRNPAADVDAKSVKADMHPIGAGELALEAGAVSNAVLQVSLTRAGAGQVAVEIRNASGARVTLLPGGALTLAPDGKGFVLVLTCTPARSGAAATTIPVTFSKPAALAPGATLRATAAVPADVAVQVTVRFTDGQQVGEVRAELASGM